MTLSDKNIFVRWYRTVKKKDPQDFCTLFWFSFWWVTIVTLNVWNIFRLRWYYLLLAVIVSVVVISAFALIAWIKERRSYKQPETIKIKRKSKLRENIETFWGAIRNKYCTKITIVSVESK